MDNGEEMLEKAMGYKFGLMEPNIKVNGWITKHKEKGSLPMLTAMFMMEIGKKIKHLVQGLIFITTVRDIKDNGWMIINMDMEYKHG